MRVITGIEIALNHWGTSRHWQLVLQYRTSVESLAYQCHGIKGFQLRTGKCGLSEFGVPRDRV
jgi:hypothetical protein